MHVRNIRALLDIDFDPFQSGTTGRVVHDFGDAHIRNRSIDNAFGTGARKHRIRICRRRRRPGGNIRRRGRDITTAFRSNSRRAFRCNGDDRARFVIGAGREQTERSDARAYCKPFFCIHERLPFVKCYKSMLEISGETSPVWALESTRIFVNSFPFCSGVPELGECTVL